MNQDETGSARLGAVWRQFIMKKPLFPKPAASRPSHPDLSWFILIHPVYLLFKASRGRDAA